MQGYGYGQHEVVGVCLHLEVLLEVAYRLPELVKKAHLEVRLEDGAVVDAVVDETCDKNVLVLSSENALFLDQSISLREHLGKLFVSGILGANDFQCFDLDDNYMDCDLFLLVVQGLVRDEGYLVRSEILDPHAVVVVKSSHVEERHVELEDNLFFSVADYQAIVTFLRTDARRRLDCALPHLPESVEMLVFWSRWFE